MIKEKRDLMKRAAVLMIAALVLTASLPAFAADLKVIANPSVKASSISASDLKEVYLGTKNSLPDGSQVHPVLAKGGAAHDTFLKDYLGKSDSALQTYYRNLVFTGRGAMPKTVSSDAEAVAYVAKTKGAIAYVSASASTEGVKTLAVK